MSIEQAAVAYCEAKAAWYQALDEYAANRIKREEYQAIAAAELEAWGSYLSAKEAPQCP